MSAANAIDRARQAAVRSLSRLPLRARRRVLYLRFQHRFAHLENPQRFSEKINWRIVNDRRPLLAESCDKLAMKAIAARSGADVKIPTTRWFGVDVGELADVDLPERWVLKPNHRSGLVYFGTGRPDVAELRRLTASWWDDMQSAWFGEWAYAQARRLLLVEDRIGAGETPPEDYKFFCFHGEPVVVQVDSDRFGDHARAFYDPQWRPLDTWNEYPIAAPIPAPQHLNEMLSATSAIGADFDHIRVDLYDAPEGVYFGEITPYAGSGLERFKPADLDIKLGERWHLPALA